MLLGLNALVSEQRLYAFDHGQTARFIAVFEAPVYHPLRKKFSCLFFAADHAEDDVGGVFAGLLSAETEDGPHFLKTFLLVAVEAVLFQETVDIKNDVGGNAAFLQKFGNNLPAEQDV